MKIKVSDVKKRKIVYGVMLSLFPILSPYSISNGGSAITDILAILLLVWFVIKKKKLVIEKDIVVLICTMLCLSLVAVLVTSTSQIGSSMKVLVVFCIYSFFMGVLWNEIEAEKFVNIVLVIGGICAFLAIVQFIFASLGISSIYSGRLPLPINQYSDFGGIVDITGTIRVHSFFEEPSYLAIYELPLIAYCFEKGKFKQGIFLSIACVVSGTMLGIIGVLFIILFMLLLGKMPLKKKIIFISIIISFCIIIFILYLKNEAISSMINYYINRYNNIDKELQRSSSSVSQRLVGNASYFNEYKVINKLVGTGANQYASYFNLQNDYSNDLVCTLLNYGIMGLISLIIFLLNKCRKIQRNGIIYVVIFVMVLSVDHIWFNEYFFYLLTWIIMFSRKDIYSLKIR